MVLYIISKCYTLRNFKEIGGPLAEILGVKKRDVFFGTPDRVYENRLQYKYDGFDLDLTRANANLLSKKKMH